MNLSSVTLPIYKVVSFRVLGRKWFSARWFGFSHFPESTAMTLFLSHSIPFRQRYVRFKFCVIIDTKELNFGLDFDIFKTFFWYYSVNLDFGSSIMEMSVDPINFDHSPTY